MCLESKILILVYNYTTSVSLSFFFLVVSDKKVVILDGSHVTTDWSFVEHPRS